MHPRGRFRKRGVLNGKIEISGKADYCAYHYIGDRLIAEKVPIGWKHQLSMRREIDKILSSVSNPNRQTVFGGGVRSQIANSNRSLINPFNQTEKALR
jgi:hypothetical protein